MIVIGSVLAIVLIGAYLFLGMKISETIVNGDVKIFFWALYTVTLISIINVSLSIYFYSTLINKKGPLGPRGLKGSMGDQGTSGNCLVGTCKTKTVQIMLEEAIQNFKEENDVTPMERKTICNMVNDNSNKSIITSWDLTNLKALRNFLYNESYLNRDIYDKLKNNNLDERIKNQNSGSDDLRWLKTLIRGASAASSSITFRNFTTDASECN